MPVLGINIEVSCTPVARMVSKVGSVDLITSGVADVACLDLVPQSLPPLNVCAPRRPSRTIDPHSHVLPPPVDKPGEVCALWNDQPVAEADRGTNPAASGRQGYEDQSTRLRRRRVVGESGRLQPRDAVRRLI